MIVLLKEKHRAGPLFVRSYWSTAAFRKYVFCVKPKIYKHDWRTSKIIKYIFINTCKYL